MNPKAFTEGIERNEMIANNHENSLKERINALSNLYFLHQGNAFKQARIIRQIQDLTS